MNLIPIVTEDVLRARVKEIGAQITRDSPGDSLLVVSVLKGSFIFLADLVREIRLPQKIDFLKVSSYGAAGTVPSGQVRFELDMSLDPAGQHVLLVEDIVDSGVTAGKVLDLLAARKPASLRAVTLLCKSHADPTIRDRFKYVGFTIGPEFVVGYGLDYAERYRERRDLCILQGTAN